MAQVKGVGLIYIALGVFIQQFMVWRVPTREIGAVPYQEGLELPPEYITRDAGKYYATILKGKSSPPS